MTETLGKWLASVIPWLLDHGIKIVFIAAASLILYKIIYRIIRRTVRLTVVHDRQMPEEADKKREDTLIRIFTGATRVIMLTLAILMILQEAGLKIGPILAGAGIAGLAVGFGGQYLIKDIITGLFIILENQYRIGDIVNIDGTSGTVQDISLRKATLRDIDGIVHHITHGSVVRVSNLSKDFARVHMDIEVAYDTNLEQLIGIINSTGMELAGDPAFGKSIIKAPAFLRITDFAQSAIRVKILGETIPLKQWEIGGEYRKRLKIAFDREGIKMSVPQRVVSQVNFEKR